MTAINSIAYELDKGGLVSLELNSKKFTVLKEKGLIFIPSSFKQIKEKKVRERLNKITKKFYNKYSDIINDNYDDINIFSDFETSAKENIKVDDVFKESAKIILNTPHKI